MAIDRNKLYMVLNENPFPVYFPSRDGDFMFDKGSPEEPTMRQVHFDDIVRVNSSSTIFKDGTLLFEQEHEADLYKELRISDWQKIWRNTDIERILRDPTMEEIEEIINFKYHNVFNRVRGIFTGMLNAGEEINSRVRTVIEKRQEELERGIKTSRMSVVPKADASEEVEELKKLVADLAAKVEAKESASEPTEAKAKEPKPRAKPATTATKKPAKPTPSKSK